MSRDGSPRVRRTSDILPLFTKVATTSHYELSFPAMPWQLLTYIKLKSDDTIDNADLRRGADTISKKWGNHVAVLIGDYIFAKSAVMVCETGNTEVVRRFAETIMELSSGELKEYFDIAKDFFNRCSISRLFFPN